MEAVTQVEALYTLVHLYFGEEYNAITESELAQDKADRAADAELPDALYKAMLVAERHGLLQGDWSAWNKGITKAEALRYITDTYRALGTYVNGPVLSEEAYLP